MGYRYDAELGATHDKSHGLGKWSATLFLFVSLTLTLMSLQIFQVTSEGPSERALARATAALTEIDLLIDRQYDDLQARAQAIQPGEVIELEHFPVSVELSKDEVLGASREQIRAIVLERSAERTYSEGTSVWRDGPESSGGAARFSVAGLTDQALSLLQSRNHVLSAVSTLVLAGVSVILTLVVIAACRNYGRAVAPAATFLAASLALLLAGVIARGVAVLMSESDAEYTQRHMVEIGEDLAWSAIRNGVALTALALVLVATSLLLATWSDRQRRAA